MAGKWDSALKQLIKINPQHFVSWLLEGTHYVGELSPHLNLSIAQTEADARQYLLDVNKQDASD